MVSPLELNPRAHHVTMVICVTMNHLIVMSDNYSLTHVILVVTFWMRIRAKDTIHNIVKTNPYKIMLCAFFLQITTMQCHIS